MKRALSVIVALAALLVGIAAPARALPRQAMGLVGLPPRPAGPPNSERYATWERVTHAARFPVDVEFVPAARTTPERVTQPDWAGPVLFAAGAEPMRIPAHRFSVIEGEWTVPFTRPTINCSNRFEQTDGSSLWIALDGWMNTYVAHAKGKDGKYHTYDSTDILQAGSESDVPCANGDLDRASQTSSYFWIEWSGTKNIAVTRKSRNLLVHPGDTIYVKIAADTTGPEAWRRATLWFVNETTGFYLPARTFRSGCVDCGTPFHRRATLFGDTAEWITEATFYSSLRRSLPNTLDDFGRVILRSAFVTDDAGVTYSPGRSAPATANIDWMTWDGVPLSQGGTLLACSASVGPATVAFARAPYVIATPGQQGQLEPKPQTCR